MGENFGRKTKVSMNTFEEINFQTLVDLVKQKSITWNVFENLLKSLAYSSIAKLKLLNAILLVELTTNYSDLDRLKYLNSILLTEFKEFMEKEDDFQNTEKNQQFDELQNSESSKEIIIKEENEMQIEQIIEDEDLERNIIKSKQIKPNAKIFSCELCHKKYGINFHLKQHIRNIHEENIEKSTIDQDLNDEAMEEIRSSSEIQMPIFCENGNKRQEDSDSPINESLSQAGDLKKDIGTVCAACGKTFSRATYLKKHIHIVHEGHKDHKCKSCGKSFSESSTLKRHIDTVHEGHKDHKCESCGKSFSGAQYLKQHIHTNS